jgi:hypothetical protein
MLNSLEMECLIRYGDRVTGGAIDKSPSSLGMKRPRPILSHSPPFSEQVKVGNVHRITGHQGPRGGVDDSATHSRPRR